LPLCTAIAQHARKPRKFSEIAFSIILSRNDSVRSPLRPLRPLREAFRVIRVIRVIRG
jgi:hypothetical protein